jgi:hypothetical protein
MVSLMPEARAQGSKPLDADVSNEIGDDTMSRRTK